MSANTGTDADDRTVLIVSTHACDIFTRADGSTTCSAGGPALYMTNAFQLLGVPYQLITGEVARSAVTPSAHGEEYTITPIAPIPLPDRLVGAAIVLSPIVREIDPDSLPPISGRLILDLQGFVREPGVSSSHVKTRFDLADLLHAADVVKASEAELGRLTADSQRALSRAIVLVTMGERGVRVRVGNREEVVPARPVRCRSTVGAGDTFLAGFTAALLNGVGEIEAARQAARFTEDILRGRAVDRRANPPSV